MTNDSINEVCKSLPSLRETSEVTLDYDLAMKQKALSLDSKFDVFISYSHKNHQVATTIYNYIKQHKPHWIVFLDQDNLKAGHSWQSKLYQSIGRC